ncbi:MAG: polyphosphate kinase 1, partial [Oscillospiraceae bacterium]|nr:polyphosphate kinase 1 [Oscillospiraceae bacterium]
SSKVAAALAYAADRGKNVLCLLELRARFDEQNNIDYSELLEDAGCHVIYGLPEHKVHSKLCVITRQHNGNLSYITQVGTGNYNEITCEQYTDLTLITSNTDVGEEAEAAFAALRAGELPPEMHTLWVAPLSFKTRVLEFLDREIAKGPAGHVAIKVNALNNPDLMDKLIECSQAGVQVELFIRGICCLRPGVPGKTDNIKVTSVVGRWLEHSRIYSFGTGEEERLFIGSGDLLNRNLERRVEAFIEVTTPDTRAQIRRILDALRNDREKSRTMQPDGSYIREENGAGTSSQEALYQYFSRQKVSLAPSEPAPAAVPASAPAETRSAPAAAPAEAPAPPAPKPSFLQRLRDFFN